MSDLYINKPTERVNILQPQVWDNIYIIAKEIFIDNILDVSNTIAGGSGGKGGNSIGLPFTGDVSVASQAVSGTPGSTGSGPTGGTGGNGGDSFVIGIVDYTAGAPGLSGTAGTSPEPPPNYAAFYPHESFMGILSAAIQTGSGGGGGGGGSAGNSLIRTCKQDLVAGGGGGGGAGGTAGGKIVLIATSTISFGSNAQLKSMGGFLGDDGEPGNYLWTEETNDAGVVTTRFIETESINATLSAEGGDGGIGSTSLTGFSSGGEGGFGGLNYRISDVGTVGECQYTRELSSAKKGGQGGRGGPGSGGSIVIRANTPSTLPTVNVNGGDSNPGLTTNNAFSGTLSLTFIPSARPAYPYFDSIKGVINSNVNEFYGTNVATTWSTSANDNLFSTTAGQVISSTDLLNLVITATPTGDFTNDSITVSLSTTDDILGMIYQQSPRMEFFDLSADVSSNVYQDSNNLYSYLCNTFAFSGRDVSRTYTSPDFLSYIVNTEDIEVAATSWYPSNGTLVGPAGGTKSASISGSTIRIFVDVDYPANETIEFISDGTGNFTSSYTESISVTETIEFEEEYTQDNETLNNNISTYEYNNIMDGVSSGDTFVEILTTDFTVTIPLTTGPDIQNIINTVLAIYEETNLIYDKDDIYPALINTSFTSPPSNNLYFVSTSSTEVSAGSILDTTKNYYLTVLDDSVSYELSTNFSSPAITGLNSIYYEMDTNQVGLSGYIIDPQITSDFENVTGVFLNPNDVAFLHIVFDPNTGTSLASATVSAYADFNVIYSPNAYIYPSLGTKTFENPEIVSGNIFALTDGTSYYLTTGFDVITIYPPITTYINTENAGMSASFASDFTLTGLVTASGFFTQESSGNVSGQYAINNSIELSAVIFKPSFLSVTNVYATFASLTAETHSYSNFTINDSSQVTPFSSLEVCINGGTQYIGYAPLSSTWDVTVSNPWYYPANLTWAADTDISALNTIIGLTADNDDEFYSSSLQAITSFDSYNVGVFKDAGTVTLTRSMTAVPSGVDGRYDTQFEDEISYNLDYNNTYIEAISAIYPNASADDYYNFYDDDVTVTYYYENCNGTFPSTITWDVYLNPLNLTTGNKLVTSVNGSYNSLSSITYQITADHYDVGEVTYNVTTNLGSYSKTTGTFYASPSIFSSSMTSSLTAGYVSATPFTFTSEATTVQDTIFVDTPNLKTTVIGLPSPSLADGITRITYPDSPNNLAVITTYYNSVGTKNATDSFKFYPSGRNNSTDQTTGSVTLSIVHPPSGKDIYLETNGTCSISAVDSIYYLGGTTSLSATIDSFGLPYVAAVIPNSATEIEANTSTTSTITADVIFDDYIDASDITSVTPQLWLYGLLSATNNYKTEYLSSGLDIIKQNFSTINYVPTSYRANEENTSISSTIDSVTILDSDFDAKTSTTNYISAYMPFNQFDNVIERDISTTISFDNVIDNLETAGVYLMSATHAGTTYTGTTSLNINFTQSVVSAFDISVIITDGCNRDEIILSYEFERYDYIIPTMYFETTIPTSYLGCASQHPQKVVVWDNVDRTQHDVILYSRGSNSVPFQEKNNRYEHLLPQWRFTDTSGTIVEVLSTINTSLSSGSRFIGVSGYNEFYYIDDLPTTADGLMIVGTLSSHNYVTELDTANAIDLPGYANSKLNAVMPYYVSDLPPSHLEVTRDGIRTHRPYYWTTTKIPYTITLQTDIPLCNGCDPILFNYPQLSTESTEYFLEMQSVSSTLYPINSTFKRLDEDNLPIMGFVRGTISPSNSGSSVTLYSSAAISVSGLYVHQPFVWVSNPENRTLNRLTHQTGGVLDTYADCIDTHTSSSLLANDALIVETPYLTSVPSGEDYAMYLSGFAGIWGVGVDSCYNVWAADTEMNRLYKYNSQGGNLYTIELNTGTAPAGVAIDKNNNVFVTLKDSISAYKYDTNGNYITALVPASGANDVDEFGNNLFAPSQIETDLNSNIWIAYYHPLSSYAIKYDKTTFEESVRIDLNPYTSPVDLEVNLDNNICVLCQFDTTNTDYASRHFVGALLEYTTTGTLVSATTGLNNPHYLAIDKNDNLWFTEGVSVVTTLSGGSLISRKLASGNITGYTSVERIEAAALPDGFGDDSELAGIGHTANNKTWVINSKENLVYILNTTTFELIATFKIYPDENLGWYNDATGQYTLQDEWYRSARAFGDWTGHNYYHKYVNGATTSVLNLTGRSEEFDVLDSPEEIRLTNDSYNMADAMSNLFRQPVFDKNNNPIFHNEYLTNVIGTDASSYQSIGRQYYEKIANFVRNNSDIETCNIEQLYSICKSLDVAVDDYNLNYPADLSRLMDIVSIHYTILRGVKNSYNMYFGPNQCVIPADYTSTNNQLLTINRQTSALPFNYITTEGEGLVIFDERNSFYDLIYTMSSTALSALSGFGLREPFAINEGFNGYSVFKYEKDNYRSGYQNNLIDWENAYNTITYETSSIEDWYGEYGLVEKWLDYEFHKGLGFI